MRISGHYYQRVYAPMDVKQYEQKKNKNQNRKQADDEN